MGQQRRAPLQVGSYISWDDASGWRHLHTVTAMTHTVSTGAAVLTVAPPMRALPTQHAHPCACALGHLHVDG